MRLISMYARHVTKVDLDFINGYLSPIALMMDYVTPEVGFDYYFHHLTGDVRRNDLTHIVRDMLKRSFLADKSPSGEPYLTPQRINELLTESYSLVPLEDWQANLGARISPWMAITDALKKANPRTPLRRKFLTNDFVDVLVHFFKDAPTECWVIEGDVQSELYLHWGGRRYDDFFFDANGEFYHLHFDLCD